MTSLLGGPIVTGRGDARYAFMEGISRASLSPGWNSQTLPECIRHILSLISLPPLFPSATHHTYASWVLCLTKRAVDTGEGIIYS